MQILIVILMFLLTALFAEDYTLYKQWSINETVYENYHFQEEGGGIYIGKVTNGDKPELLYFMQRKDNHNAYRAILRDGKTKEQVFIIGCEKYFLGVFDLNLDGYNEIYTTPDKRKKYSFIDTKDYSTHNDSLPYEVSEAWTVATGEVPEDRFLIAIGDGIRIFRLPDLSYVRGANYSRIGPAIKVEVEDFDNDGEREICIYSSFDAPNYRSEFLFFNYKTLQLKYSIPLEGFYKGSNISIVDVNKDGYPDFVLGASGKNGDTVLLIDGQSKSLLHEYPSFNYLPGVGRFYDSDTPYLVDIAYTDKYRMRVYSLFDPYQELWASEDEFPQPQSSSNLSTGDLDADGKTDIVFCNLDYICHYNSTPVGFNTTTSAIKLPSSTLSTYPNPFTTRLSLSLPSPASIYSLTGQLIKTLPKGKHEVDTRNWRNGVYLIHCQGIDTKRIIKID